MTSLDMPAGRLTPQEDTSAIAPAPVSSGPGRPETGAGSPGLGLSTAQLDLTPALSTTTRTVKGADGNSVATTYLNGPQGVLTNPAEPALPLITRNVSVRGKVLRGVGFRSGSYVDTRGVTPLTGAPATERGSGHGAFTPSTFYPSRIATGNYF